MISILESYFFLLSIELKKPNPLVTALTAVQPTHFFQ
jgi:hypothetical protein